MKAQRSEASIRAETLRKAADHLESARTYLWNNAERRVTGWASAAAELRRLADEAEGKPAPPTVIIA